jgi:hypothetical protein
MVHPSARTSTRRNTVYGACRAVCIPGVCGLSTRDVAGDPLFRLWLWRAEENACHDEREKRVISGSAGIAVPFRPERYEK